MENDAVNVDIPAEVLACDVDHVVGDAALSDHSVENTVNPELDIHMPSPVTDLSPAAIDFEASGGIVRNVEEALAGSAVHVVHGSPTGALEPMVHLSSSVADPGSSSMISLHTILNQVLMEQEVEKADDPEVAILN